MRGENDSKQSDEFQATIVFALAIVNIVAKNFKKVELRYDDGPRD